MVPNAPEDMFISTGFYERFIFVIPSLEIVIVHLERNLSLKALILLENFIMPLQLHYIRIILTKLFKI
ncbi:MAG: hypothetical protein ACFFAN_11485 [Promethearchaeota archaeon]